MPVTLRKFFFMSRNVTNCHELSRNVTKCHQLSSLGCGENAGKRSKSVKTVKSKTGKEKVKFLPRSSRGNEAQKIRANSCNSRIISASFTLSVLGGEGWGEVADAVTQSK